ncbi:MAG: polysaccharide deacetylase family protein [Magnetococcales bacterium]|nr:polysaccharide deacetylase family protein [Magnetococcales bacterium]
MKTLLVHSIQHCKQTLAQLRHRIAPLPWPAMQQHIEAALTTKPPLKTGQKNHPPGVYIFLYHSFHHDHSQAWARLYRKAATHRDHFLAHLDYLRHHMTPIRLSAVPELFRQGTLERPYFVITFDDAYTNILTDVAPALIRHGIQPTLFACGAFTQGRNYYRVLVSVLLDQGFATTLADHLRQALPEIPWSHEQNTLFTQTKDFYHPVIQSVVEQCYATCLPAAPLRVHMNADELRQLQQHGWEIGNHTLEHETLSALNAAQIHHTLAHNHTVFQQLGIELMPWVSYPNGLARHVKKEVHDWMQAHPELHGIFAGGGVNFRPSQTEWLRIGIGDHDLGQFIQRIELHVAATRRALERQTV